MLHDKLELYIISVIVNTGKIHGQWTCYEYRLLGSYDPSELKLPIVKIKAIIRHKILLYPRLEQSKILLLDHKTLV
jgi:hypothetical protein